LAEHRIKTEIEIDAPAARVWAVLTDFPGMSSWNPFITSISGSAVEGARLSIKVLPPGKSAARFRPTVLVVRPERELRWLGRVLFPGIFDGEHYFLLEPLGERRSRLEQGEKFSGLLVGFLGDTLRASEAGFNMMNQALKRQAEAA